MGTSDGSSLAWGALLTRFLPSAWLLADQFPENSPREPLRPTVGLFVSQLCRLSPVWTFALRVWTVMSQGASSLGKNPGRAVPLEAKLSGTWACGGLHI